ncbi:MAG: hypothetical protein IPG53_18785 [Ignavibacteriales bacterium]|nr:hypothetical protein [Ignavibacteriales bacterium]
MIDDTKNAGHDWQRVEIEYYSRFSFPFTAIIIIIFGLRYRQLNEEPELL